MKLPFAKRELAILAVLLAISFSVRFAFFWHQGFESIDTLDFKIWFQTAAEHGPRNFYDNVWSDYPPFNVYIFWIFGLIAENLSLFGSSLFTYIMKLPANLFDLGTSFLIFAFVRKRLDFKIALLATAVYAFNPAVIFNAAVWGQFDAIYTFFLIFSLYLTFNSKPKLAAIAYMLGVLTKPQSIALAPLMIYLIYRNFGWKEFLKSVAVAVGTVFAVILPFNWNNPVTFLGNIYFGAYQTYGYTTINAFNIWAFGGMWVKETPLEFFLGWGMFLSLATFAVYMVHKRFEVSKEMVVLFSAFVLFFGFFMLPTRIHERYLFPAMAVLAMMVPFIRKTRPIYAILTGTLLVNEAYVLHILNAGEFLQLGDPIVIVASLINSLMLIYVLMLMGMELRGKGCLPKKIANQKKTGEMEK